MATLKKNTILTFIRSIYMINNTYSSYSSSPQKTCLLLQEITDFIKLDTYGNPTNAYEAKKLLNNNNTKTLLAEDKIKYFKILLIKNCCNINKNNFLSNATIAVTIFEEEFKNFTKEECKELLITMIENFSIVNPIGLIVEAKKAQKLIEKYCHILDKNTSNFLTVNLLKKCIDIDSNRINNYLDITKKLLENNISNFNNEEINYLYLTFFQNCCNESIKSKNLKLTALEILEKNLGKFNQKLLKQLTISFFYKLIDINNENSKLSVELAKKIIIENIGNFDNILLKQLTLLFIEKCIMSENSLGLSHISNAIDLLKDNLEFLSKNKLKEFIEYYIKLDEKVIAYGNSYTPSNALKLIEITKNLFNENITKEFIVKLITNCTKASVHLNGGIKPFIFNTSFNQKPLNNRMEALSLLKMHKLWLKTDYYDFYIEIVQILFNDEQNDTAEFLEDYKDTLSYDLLYNKYINTSSTLILEQIRSFVQFHYSLELPPVSDNNSSPSVI